MRSSTKLALLAAAAVVVAQLLVRGGAPKLAPGSAPPPLSLPDLDGRIVDLASLKGQVVVVNFWATWCGPCRQELPELAAAATANRDRCVQLLGVAEESPRDEVMAVGAGLPYPVLLDGRAEAAAAWKVRGYPHTFVIDADGLLRLNLEGALTRAELERAIEPLRPASCTGRPR